MSTSSTTPEAAPAASPTEPVAPVPPKRTARFDSPLRVTLTLEELLKEARKQSDLLKDKAALEDEKKSVTSQYKTRIDSVQTSIDVTAEKIRCGWEIRNVPCEVIYNDPKPGMKRTVRLDTGEDVNIEQMTASDREKQLDFEKSLQPPAPAEEPDFDITSEDQLDFDADQVHIEDERFDELDCNEFADQYRDLFIDPVEPDGLYSEEDRINAAFRLIETDYSGRASGKGELQHFKDWILSTKRGTVLPGKKQAIAALEEAERRHADLAKIEEQKKKKGRKKTSPGTVECPADEGSRDDAGSETKNDY